MQYIKTNTAEALENNAYKVMKGDRKALLKQKLLGAGMIAIGLVSPLFMDNDGTAALLFIPCGIALLTEKGVVL